MSPTDSKHSTTYAQRRMPGAAGKKRTFKRVVGFERKTASMRSRPIYRSVGVTLLFQAGWRESSTDSSSSCGFDATTARSLSRGCRVGFDQRVHFARWRLTHSHRAQTQAEPDTDLLAATPIKPPAGTANKAKMEELVRRTNGNQDRRRYRGGSCDELSQGEMNRPF